MQEGGENYVIFQNILHISITFNYNPVSTLCFTYAILLLKCTLCIQQNVLFNYALIAMPRVPGTHSKLPEQLLAHQSSLLWKAEEDTEDATSVAFHHL